MPRAINYVCMGINDSDPGSGLLKLYYDIVFAGYKRRA